jgi:hypothetical protein
MTTPSSRGSFGDANGWKTVATVICIDIVVITLCKDSPPRLRNLNDLGCVSFSIDSRLEEGRNTHDTREEKVSSRPEHL